MTYDLSMSIQLKKVTGSEAGSDMDALSDRGGAAGNNNNEAHGVGPGFFGNHPLTNAATMEYFAAPESSSAVMAKTRKRRMMEE